MALVAYGSGSSSESEDEDSNKIEGVVTINIKKPQCTTNPSSNGLPTTADDTAVSASAASNYLFTNLPQPVCKETNTVEEEQDEFLSRKEVAYVERPKKVKQRIKIGVPLVSEYDSDEDEPIEKKVKTSGMAGLFSLLPAPKTTPLSNKSFIPHILQKKANKPTPTKSSKPIVPTKTKKSLIKKTELKAGNISESDDNMDEDLPAEFDVETWEKVCGRRKRPQPVLIDDPQTTSEFLPIVVEAAPEAPEPYSGLDNRAFKELVGKPRRGENIKLIDINEDEIRPDREEWLKSLTDPACEPKASIANPVNDTCKRKHHITYLAEQAKAQEKELQNQWSNSRFSRKQTQAKYGF